MKKLISSLVGALALGACAYPYTPPALSSVTAPAGPATGALGATPTTAMQERRQRITLLISIDGFRPDYLDRGVTPVLSRLAAEGVTGPMRPSFPSKTFPNHWTLVTGKVPDRNGIVGNSMIDPRWPDESFTMATVAAKWWDEAEPIWVTAERAGVRTATLFWPGSAVAWGAKEVDRREVGGVRPTDWWPFADPITDEQRVRAIADWMRRPAAIRPQFVTLYFDEVDHAGHDAGPDSPEVNVAIAQVDAALGALARDLAALGQPTNVVIVADHGMAATASDRVIALDTLLPVADARIVEQGSYASLEPATGRDAAVAAALLKPHPHMQCWRKGAIPARFRYGRNPRVPAYLCLAEPGWLVQKSAPTKAFRGGNHGYDNDAASMRALFIANGPAFVGGRRIAAFDNTAIAPLLRDLIGLPAGTDLDGDDRPFRGVLRRR